MRSDDYADPPLWTLLDEVARWNRGDLTMSRLAAQVKTSTGYDGAYRAIGRLVAAGYAEYDVPPTSATAGARVSVKLTARGRSRWSLGKSWPSIFAAQLRATTEAADQRSRQWIKLYHASPGKTA